MSLCVSVCGCHGGQIGACMLGGGRCGYCVTQALDMHSLGGMFSAAAVHTQHHQKPSKQHSWVPPMHSSCPAANMYGLCCRLCQPLYVVFVPIYWAEVQAVGFTTGLPFKGSHACGRHSLLMLANCVCNYTVLLVVL